MWRPQRLRVSSASGVTYYVASQKAPIIAQAAKSTPAEAAKLARQTPGFEGVTAKQVKGWSAEKPHKKMGRKVNDAFEHAVLDKLVYTSVAKKDTAGEVAIVANVAYSYSTIRLAAIEVQNDDLFKDDPKVLKLKFTEPWIALARPPCHAAPPCDRSGEGAPTSG